MTKTPTLLVTFSLLLLSFILTLTTTHASAPALSTKEAKAPSTTQQTCQAGDQTCQTASAKQTPPCDSLSEEDRILCEAASAEAASIKQVIAEDPTTETSGDSSASPPADRAGDVWSAAYKQWIKGNPTDQDSDSAKRAIEAARKRLSAAGGPAPADSGSAAASAARPPSNETLSLEATDDDDELTLITRAARVLQQGKASAALSEALALVEELCASGDNGRQFAASSGLPALIRLVAHDDEGLSVSSARALASCAQNNAPVFDAAVADGAVPALATAAVRSVAHRAAALRALVAVGTAEQAADALWGVRDGVVAVVTAALAPGDAEVLGDARRGLVRGLAAVELCVSKGEGWRELFTKAGVLEHGVAAMRNEDVDVKEGAARVVRLLKSA